MSLFWAMTRYFAGLIPFRFAETLREVAQRREPGDRGDLLDGKVRCAQQVLAFLEPQRLDILDGRHPVVLAENMRQVILVDLDLLGQLVQRDVLAEMRVDVLLCAAALFRVDRSASWTREVMLVCRIRQMRRISSRCPHTSS